MTVPDSIGGRGAATINPADRARLATSPVPMRRVVALFKPYWRPLVVVSVIIVGTSLLALAQPFLVRAIIDDALPNHRTGLLVAAVSAMIVVTVVTQLLGVVQTWMSTKIGQQVMHRLRTDVFSHLQELSLAFFKRTRGGEVQARITQDIAGMQGVVTNTATSIASNVTSTVATLAAMVALSPRLALLSLIVVPPAVWLTRRVALVRREMTLRQQRQLADIQTQIDEGLSVSGVQLAKTLGSSGVVAQRFERSSAELIDLELRSQMAGRWRMGTMQIVFAVIPALIYLAAGFPATSGGMTIGTLVAFTGLQAGLFRPLMGLFNVGAQWISSMALFSRIFEYLDLPVDVPRPTDPVHLPQVSGRVDMRDVTFAYDDAAEPALTDVSFTVPAGTSLAIVGHTGSGKSTIAALLARLADPTSGSVTLDGVDLRRIDPEQLAAHVGVVSQDTYLIHDSIRANLALAAPDASEAEMWAALRTAHIDEVVAGLPDGLDTVVGARGHRFSGGERQRLAIARTVLRNPRVLLLDEATSALDNVTERAVQRAIDQLIAGRTTVMIAHRLSTVEGADQIIVLDGGRVVERGTYPELVAARGAFAALAGALAA